jgi:DNA phosphorothioation-associated putative methyltransferase
VTQAVVVRHRAAVSRIGFSKPVRLALDDGLIAEGSSVFDYGCGKGADLRLLQQRGIEATGWDPAFLPRSPRQPADVVNLGYVINVIEDPTERVSALREAWSLTKKVLVVAARLTSDLSLGTQSPYQDGYLTRCGTFQKYFEQSGLRDWIDSTLNVSAVPACPGIFYIFRDPGIREAHIASRYRRKIQLPHRLRTEALYERNREALQPLLHFMVDRGRLPDQSELPNPSAISQVFGTLRRAFQVIQKATGHEHWTQVRDQRAHDLLIYLALARFTHRPKFSDLPKDIQLDVKAFFPTYGRACDKADELLFSAGDITAVSATCAGCAVGKKTPNALYLHKSLLPLLPPILRVYEGCARSYMGAVDAANVIKLHRHRPQISYLLYREFDRSPHPVLSASLVVPLQTFRVQYRDYRQVENPPILHRKEDLLPPDHPDRQKLERLSRSEEKYGLYDRPEQIGTRNAWLDLLAQKGVRHAGHRLVKRKS